MVSLRPELTGLMVPSKIYGILATKRPIIFIGSRKSVVSGILSDAKCGYTIEPYNPDATDEIVEKILSLYKHPEVKEEFGINALAYFRRNFERGISASKYLSLVKT